MEAALDNKLSATQRQREIQNVFIDDAIEFYQNYLQLTGTTTEEVTIKMQNKDSSIT